MERYVKDGVVLPKSKIVINSDGYNTFNPTEEMLLSHGWQRYIAPELTEEEIERNEKENGISLAKAELDNTDYKVIKCMEAYLCGEELPYDIQELHKERNAHRVIINELEQ